MRAEILSIGTEILIGSTLDTNSRFLSQKLAENAVDVYHHHTVGDNIQRISEAFRTACEHSELVISTGGLGPTEDDATVRGLSLFLDRPLRPHEPTRHYILKRLKGRGFDHIPKLVEKQCYVPEGCGSIFQNNFGTAPGLICKTVLDKKKKIIVVLPGPPREMQPMFLRQILPALRLLMGLSAQNFLVHTLKIAGVPESHVAQKVNDLLQRKPPLTVGIYSKFASVELKVMVKTSTKARALAQALRIENTIRKRLGSKVYGVNDDTLSSVLGALLKRSRQTLSVAESCTGGLLGSRLTETAGSSNYFLGGVLAYHDRVKEEQLGISKKILAGFGAVSERCARLMAQNVRKKFGSDHAIAITGIAGPSGGSRSKPVGSVYIALADKRTSQCRHYRFFGNRQENQSRAADEAIDLLRLKLLKEKK